MASILTANGLKGRYKLSYGQTKAQQAWARLCRTVKSDQPDGETYAGRQGIDGIHEAKGDDRRTDPIGVKFALPHRKFQGGFTIPGPDWRFNKVGSVQDDLDELSEQASVAPAELLLTTIMGAGSLTGVDGKAFFATDHPIDGANTQSNELTAGVLNIGATVPTTEEWYDILFLFGLSFRNFKQATGLRIMPLQRDITIAVNDALFPSLTKAITTLNGTDGESNALKSQSEFRFSPLFLPDYTEDLKMIAIADAKGAFIYQELESLGDLDVFADGSEYYRDHDEVKATVRGYYNCGIDRWQGALRATLS